MKLFLRIGVILCMFSSLVGCSSFGYQSRRYVKLAHEITEKIAKELKAQKNLCLAGTGGQMMDEKAAGKAILNQKLIKKVSQPKSKKATINEVVAKDGAKVNINVESLEHSMFELTGEGFKPYESLNVISKSYEEILHARVTADKNGKILPIGLLPAVIGKSGGVCHIHILRKEGSIHIKFPWGTEALKTN